MAGIKPYQGIRTFLKSQYTTGNNFSMFNVIGIPLDCGTTNRPGARFGPSAIRDASAMLTDGYHPRYLVDPTPLVIDHGDLTLSNNNILTSVDEIHTQIEGMMSTAMFSSSFPVSQSHLVSLGGDHTVTLGILRALKKLHGKLQIVHIDAHSDCSASHMGDPVGHGTWVKNAIEEDLIDVQHMTSIGVRAPTGRSGAVYLEKKGGRTINAWDAQTTDPDALAAQILLTYDLTRPTYLTFDVDGIDPSMAPGTGTPEVGGLTSAWALRLIQGLQKLNWVGMDVVEVSPSYDQSQITALLAATVAWTYMCMNVAKQPPNHLGFTPSETDCNMSSL